MGLKADIEPGQSVIVGDVVIRCEYKKGGRTRLDIIAPEKTVIVSKPTDVEVDAAVSVARNGRATRPS